MMSTNGMSCGLVDEGDIDSRYLAGSLTEEEAEAFEAHFFACQRCWDLVQQGLSVRAAFEGSSAPSEQTRRRAPFSPWWGLAAAAAVVVTVVGIRRAGSGRETDIAGEVPRGGEAVLSVHPTAGKGAVMAAWPKLPGADVYRVRLFTADGTLVLGREVTDTAITLEQDVLTGIPSGGPAFWEVQALGPLREEIARSDLTKAVLPTSGP